MSNPISKKTDADIAQLKNKTVYSIPDNPSNKGFSAKQIKDKFAGPILEVAEWVKALSEETYDLGENINDIDEKCDDIVDGTLTAKKAEQDQSGNNIKATYGASLSHSLTGGSNSWTFTIKLHNKNGNELDTETQVFGTASSLAAGLMSADDKNKVDTIETYAKSLSVSIVHVASDFEHFINDMSPNRVTKKEAIDRILASREIVYGDAALLLANYISPYSIGDTVRLTNGKQGKVTSMTPLASRPIVTVNNRQIDLAKNKGVSILEVVAPNG